MSTVALERGWTELSAFSTEQVVRGVAYREESRVTLNDLVALVSGRHGDELQRDFVDALSRGAKHPPGGERHSLAGHCVIAGDLQPLLVLASAAEDVRISGAPVTKSEWLDAMSTCVSAGGGARTCTLFELAVAVRGPFAKEVMAFALEHQSGHAIIDQLLARGGRSTSLMAEALLSRRLAGDTAAAGAPPAVTPPPRRRPSL